MTKYGEIVYHLLKAPEQENSKTHCEQRSDEAALNFLTRKEKGNASLARNEHSLGLVIKESFVRGKTNKIKGEG